MLTKLKDLIAGKASLDSPTRSSKWRSVRAAYLRIHPCCAVCGGTRSINVHHIQPFHTHPELELDPSNLITLCESGKKGLNCHLLVGHLGNFRNINTESVNDSIIWSEKLKITDDANI